MIRDILNRVKFVYSHLLSMHYIETRMWRNWQTRWI
jgi:hypothetical protein